MASRWDPATKLHLVWMLGVKVHGEALDYDALPGHLRPVL